MARLEDQGQNSQAVRSATGDNVPRLDPGITSLLGSARRRRLELIVSDEIVDPQLTTATERRAAALIR